MKKEIHSPNRTAYDKLCFASKEDLEKHLILACDGTWHIVRACDPIHGSAQGPLESNIQQIFMNWEDMLRTMTHKSFETLHKSIWPDIKISKALQTKEALCVLIWNYRLSKAIDWTKPADNPNAPQPKNPLQRASAIAGRVYGIITPPTDAKPFTSKAGLACLKIIIDVCGDSKTCTEGQLKPVICERGLEITKTAAEDPTSAWRFLQFYRPQLVESQLITYIK